MGKRIPIYLLLLWLTAAPAFAEVVVIVRRQAQPGGNYVRVCDIARVDGPPAQAREVAMTVIGPAPEGGETREITRWDIESRLYEMGVGANVTFSGNDVVRVFGAGASMRQGGHDERDPSAAPDFQPLAPTPELALPLPRRENALPNTRLERLESERRPAAKPAPAQQPASKPDGSAPGEFGGMDAEGRIRVARAIGDHFADQYRAGNSKRLDIEVSASVAGSTGGVPASAHEIRVEAAEGKIPGRAKVTLFVRDGADSAGREVTVAADTEVHGLALVAARNIAKGEMIGAGDVQVRRVRMEWGKNYLPPRAKAVSGREASRALRPGDALGPEDAVPGTAVKRRQFVIVDTAGKGWRLQTKARAHESGTVGDIITVEDLETKAKYPVRITGMGTVSVVVDKDKLIYNRD